MKITAEMVQAAKNAYWAEVHNGSGYGDKCYEAAIASALEVASKNSNEDPHEDIRLYPGDGALVMRENGDMTIVGSHIPDLVLAFNVFNGADTEEDE
ncbi:hypothetical protein CN234_17400 [Sinorhizobium meliloti]|uniref:hypothetical protein n=1 Tax=Rhizobium meliloti TaxID=382 RepID=UPI000FD5368F|nr:hypothetical protein [Sinorhizobium meliloti]RVG08558.1 hypothetical protein CN234_17400 [Sinorhizobium meliloti]RVL48469.1 hypothetical protein CN145_23185 [Sinorhizobium meliloti]